MLKRFFDVFISLTALIILSPLMLLIVFWIISDSRGGAFYSQLRVGRNKNDFRLWKFRSMRLGSDSKGLLTVGKADHRITPVGRILRSVKLDELPQLWNVLNGSMSMVGPRPEVRKYVDMYTERQLQVLQLRPGITDYASLHYYHENSLLENEPDPEAFYIEVIMPAKLEINLEYIEKRSIRMDFNILFLTLASVCGISKSKN
ncbi:MAG: sugar transferase [Bacteroidales bacterium]|nr:sugar transferase [Bacteroidales bacterium]